MTRNPPDIDAVLRSGGTVVVPSRQRAVAVGLAWSGEHVARGLGAWPAADVLPFSAWLQRTVDEARLRHLPGRRRLGSDEEWLLWRAVAREAGEALGLLHPAALGEQLSESRRLRRDWRLGETLFGQGSEAGQGPEAGFYGRAVGAFDRRCADLRAVAGDDWPQLLAAVPPTTRSLLFAGFRDPGPALVRRIEALGGRWLQPAPAAGETAGVRADSVVVAEDRGQELLEAALWCRARLLRDPAARLLVVVPQLAQYRSQAARVFARVLAGSGLLAGAAAAGPGPEPLFALEGGQPLADFPLVRAALALVALASGEQDFVALSGLLRSPHLRLGGLAARAGLELRLRKHDVARADLRLLARLARRGSAPSALADVLERLAALADLAGQPLDSLAGWARRFAQWLAQAGWPGEQALGSAEQQQCQRFDVLLGDFAQLAGSGGRVAAGEAAGLLAMLAARVSFEAASGDVPVTITASTGDPLVRYDGIRVLGLNAEYWPKPAQPDPFIPVAIQRAAGMAAASPAGQLELARAAMQGWRAATGELVFSCARVEEDAEMQPSSLLGLGAPREGPGAPAPTRTLPVEPLLAAMHSAARSEPMPADAPAPWPAGRALPGGTWALSLQSDCPFHALAELRLGAQGMPEPARGLPARDRGRILHRALELYWRRLGSSQALRACTIDEADRLAADCAGQAIAGIVAGLPVAPPPALLDIEAQRLRGLLRALRAEELQRPEFRVLELEAARECNVAGLPIRVRLDRVDLLAGDGRRVVLDYKSGAARAFDPLAARPAQAQLLAYAVLEPGELAGIATVHLKGGQVEWRGAASAAEVLPGLPVRGVHHEQWPAWLAHWRELVPRLATEFSRGTASVDPRPGACEYCHLAALCRVGGEGRARGLEADAGAAEGDGTVRGGAAGAAGAGDE